MKREHIFAHYEEDASRYWKLQEGGYATPMSVRQGERVIFHISNSRSYYDIFVFREGANRRLVKEINDLRGALHAVPDFGYRDGFDWTPKASPTPQTPGSTRPWGSTTTATTARWPSTKRSSKGRYSPPRPSNGRMGYTGMTAP